MTPEPALWNWRSRGFESGGTSKKRRKIGSSSKECRWSCAFLKVPRVAMLTTAGDTRLTMGASEGIGAASAAGAGRAAYAGPGAIAAGPAMTAAVSVAAANLRRRFMRGPSVRFFSATLKAGRVVRPALGIVNIVHDTTRKTALGGPS